MAAYKVPCMFIGNAILTYIVVGNGSDTLSFHTDTGGGIFVFQNSVQNKTNCKITNHYVVYSCLIDNKYLQPKLNQNRMPVASNHFKKSLQKKGVPSYIDGLLGQRWFGNKCWRFDYLKKEVWVHVPPLSVKDPGVIQLGFLQDSNGNQVNFFPRVPIVIEGDTIDVLFDTGASSFIISNKQFFTDTFNQMQGSSFITEMYFNKWRKAHPEWRYFKENKVRSLGLVNISKPTAEMIEVPIVRIGDKVVGPVWFEKRYASNYKQLSALMDKPVFGAIGGSCLKYFSITVDYPNKLALFKTD